jgi:hypothetical protein
MNNKRVTDPLSKYLDRETLRRLGTALKNQSLINLARSTKRKLIKNTINNFLPNIAHLRNFRRTLPGRTNTNKLRGNFVAYTRGTAGLHPHNDKFVSKAYNIHKNRLPNMARNLMTLKFHRNLKVVPNNTPNHKMTSTMIKRGNLASFIRNYSNVLRIKDMKSLTRLYNTSV